MKILNIELRNFRAAKSVKVDIAAGAPGKVITLVGLNESGKTTILEGISNFVSSDPETQNLVQTLQAKDEPKTFIPKHEKGMFSSDIRIIAKIEMNEHDFSIINKALSSQKIYLKEPSFPVQFTVERRFTFEDSALVKEVKLWTLWDYKYRLNINSGPLKSKPKTAVADKTWHAIVRELNAILPKIVYFPTFLFGMPDRIYLSDHENETPQNLYYRKTISNILKSINKKYSVENHIVKRVKELLSSGDMLSLSDSEKTSEINSVVRDLANEISRVITGAWKEIIGGKTSNQRVEARWSVDQNKDNAVYIELSLIAGERAYLLKERSMGFRWFFSFLFFTQFRRLEEENGGTIFLFDEPASNLHSAAQTSLLDSFEKIMGDNDHIIYSTHSHYMINPLWLGFVDKGYPLQG